MDLKKEVKDIVKWAQESEDNKKKAVNMSTMIINLLNLSNDKITDKEMEKIVGAHYCDFWNFSHCTKWL